MRRIVFALAGVLLAGIAAGQSWTNGPQSPFSYCRFDGEYFPATAKVYFLGGRIGNSTTRPDIYSYTPATGAYADLGVDMRLAVSNYDVCLLRDNHDLPTGDTFGLYIVGGRYDASPNYTDSVQAFYPISNTALILATDVFPGRVGGQITVAQSSIVYDNLMFSVGGFSQTGNATSAEAWSFDPLGTPGARWSRLRDMPLARAYPIVAVVDSFLFAFGGDSWRSPDSLMARAQCQRLNLCDTAAGWSAVRDMPAPTAQARGFGFDSDDPGEFRGKVVVAGRGVWPAESANCYIYDVARDSWAVFPSLAQRRRNHAGVFIPAEAGGTGVPGMWVFGGRQTTDTNGLRISEYYVVNQTGMEEGKGRPAARLFVTSNPSRGAFSLRLAGSARVEVFDVLGKPVWSGTFRGERRVSGLAAGAYFLRALTPSGWLERKVIVTR